MNHLPQNLLVVLFLFYGSMGNSYYLFHNDTFSNGSRSDRPAISRIHQNDTSIICVDTTNRLLLHEDTLAVSASSIAETAQGDILIPGFCYPDAAFVYNSPYLIKCTPEGSLIWSRRYDNAGSFPSSWWTATRILELHNGDLLMTGQIGVPGTDDRRELAVWRLDKNGSVLWGTSFESLIWTDPITGATEVRGICEDPSGNLYISGGIKIFEASKYAFLLKLDAKGNILWDNNYASDASIAFGAVLQQDKILLIGSMGSLLESSSAQTVLWCLMFNTADGKERGRQAWSPDFGPLSGLASFNFANGSVNMLDNGQISVQGTARADFLAMFSSGINPIQHSIIANFSPDFAFNTGIMVCSRHPSNYYNTLATQAPDGTISYTRFIETNMLYQEDIVYGRIQGNKVVKEKSYHESVRSSSSVSNFLYRTGKGELAVQTYWDSIAGRGGLEMVRLRDGDSSSLCNGGDTSASFVQSYVMKPAHVSFDSVILNAFRPTHHNSVSSRPGNLFSSTACAINTPGFRSLPNLMLDKDSMLCAGSTRELNAGPDYSSYSWSNGSTGSSITVSDTGRYWVSVKAADGCRSSDTTRITTKVKGPSGFLSPDSILCTQEQLKIQASDTFQTYLWSNQSTGNSITVSQPGNYWLQVTDNNQCSGTDSIHVIQKQCLEDLEVPNAFTPNGDGRNDILRPVLPGNIVWFRFAVYNRWGQKVYETETLHQGWDGRLNGVQQASGAFAWYCEYQLDGQPEKIKKGTVLLLR
jgi:gliding motility-associated-like protein